MLDIELFGYKISKINMINDIPETGPLQLKNNIKFNIDYADDNETAEAILLSCIEHMKNPGMFLLEIEIKAIFEMDGIKSIDEREEANLRCYDELFYCMEQIMAYLMANTGIEGVRLRKTNIIPNCTDSEISKLNDESVGKIIEFSPDI